MKAEKYASHEEKINTVYLQYTYVLCQFRYMLMFCFLQGLFSHFFPIRTTCSTAQV